MYIKDDDEKWILDYLSSGKGTILYQMNTDFDSLNIRPEKDFFEHLKEENISTEEYENVKNFFNILKLETLGDLNSIYNFQDTAKYFYILCEIFESRSALLQKLFK